MDRRERKSALDNYLDSLTYPPEKLKKISEFYHNLRSITLQGITFVLLETSLRRSGPVQLHTQNCLDSR
ncbi:hypothetical protein NECAME_07416 [Necator americanus]|uniref:Uncharacterized protein n=1 Tax=Necator americanus TaxID=51031 RepID=W2TMM9_NECAM|nr:hypothetical protein NECAME_07416 [Necator americanus]ETN83355.1 hypothetical protein NECAME_07416 [Necator americanus]